MKVASTGGLADRFFHLLPGLKASSLKGQRPQGLPPRFDQVQIGCIFGLKDELPALVAAAEATSTLRVSSLVFDNDFRHLVMLAKEAATLDVLSDGRLELGVGAGWLKPEYEQAGIPFERASVRIARMEVASTTSPRPPLLILG